MKTQITYFLILFILFKTNTVIAQQYHLDVEGDVKVRGNLDIHSGDDSTSIYIGYETGKNTVPPFSFGAQNTFVGSKSGVNNTDGRFNSFFGYETGLMNLTGNFNSFFGHESGLNNTIGYRNTFMGYQSGGLNINGYDNAFFGQNSGFRNTSGKENTFIGQNSGLFNTIGFQNVFLGKSSGNFNRAGSSNVFLGYDAGSNNRSGNKNIMIGAEANTLDTSQHSSIAIGYNAKVDCSNCAVLGGTGSDAVKLGIGVDSPTTVLMLLAPGSTHPVGITQNQVAGTAAMEFTTTDNSGQQATRLIMRGNADLREIEFYRGGRGAETLTMILKGDSGNVGIGTSNPGYRLQVGVNGDGSQARANAWNTFSDGRWKKNIEPILDPTEKLMSVSGYYYHWIEGIDETRQVGVIAQEVEEVLPEAVSTDTEGFKSVDYGKLSVLVIEAVKEQQEMISDQQAEIKALKQEMAELKKLLKTHMDQGSD